jgi:hypothetical protein
MLGDSLVIVKELKTYLQRKMEAKDETKSP